MALSATRSWMPWGILQSYGLGDLSMRRLAEELGVQPAAPLLACGQQAGASRGPRPAHGCAALHPPVRRRRHPARARRPPDPREFRSLILAVRDSADVSGVAHSITPGDLSPVPGNWPRS